MDEQNPEIEVQPMARRTFSDDRGYNEFRDLIINPWRPLDRAEDFKQAIRFAEAQ